MNKNVYFLLSGQAVSQIGDKFHMIAISFWVLKTTGSPARMGAVLAASLLPSLIVGLFSGAFIDRYNRKWIIVGTDVLRGVIIAGFALMFYSGWINFSVIIIMQVLLSVNAAFFDPAIPAIIPTIVDKKDLATVNSLYQFVNGFATIAGGFLGGVLVSMAGYLVVFILNAISFLLSAGFEWLIEIPENLSRQEKSSTPGRRVLRDMKEGYSYLLSRFNFIILLLMVMVIHFFVGSIEVMMPVIADKISLEGAKTLGFFHAAFGAGTIGMALLIGVRSGFRNEKKALFGAVTGIGIFYMAGSAVGVESECSFTLYLMVLFGMGCCIMCAGIAFRTLLQKSIDNTYAGRVFAVAGSLSNASIPLAMIGYGVLLDSIGYRSLLGISGVCLLPLGLLSYLLYKEEKYDPKGKNKENSLAED